MGVLICRLNSLLRKGLTPFLRRNRSARSGDVLLKGSSRLFAQLDRSAKTELRCYDLIDSRDRTLKIKYDNLSEAPQSRTT